MGAISEKMGSVGNFFAEVSTEMKKIDWPSRQELLESTLVVVASLVMLGLFIFVCDTVLTNLMKLIIP